MIMRGQVGDGDMMNLGNAVYCIVILVKILQ